jgi:hypothetical protein
MQVKLTLSIDKEKVKKIKRYAIAKGVSVSNFLEQQIDNVTTIQQKNKLDIAVLRGAFGNAARGFSWKKEKAERLMKKYIK